jgi:hypothetical protein
VIDQGDQSVAEWVGSVLDGVEVTFAPPSRQVADKATVSIYLHDLLPASATVDNRRTPSLKLQLRYLITTAAKDPLEAHRMLGELVFSAMEHKAFQVNLEPLPAAAWQALGVAPLPAFMLQTLLIRPREQTHRFVRQTVDLSASPVVTINGIVVGPRDLPIVNARVEYPAAGAVTHTDNKGYFHLVATPPSSEASSQFLIQAKGREQSVSVKPKEMQNQPVVIHFDVLEA